MHPENIKINILLRHCSMYLYASEGHPERMANPAAQDFFIFGLLHLISTMFITLDNRKEKHGGVFHRILDPMGYGDLLDEVDDILSLPVGKTNFKQYIRTKRNKLAAHGTLKFDSQDKKAQEVIEDYEALEQYCQAMHRLDTAILKLQSELTKLIRDG